MSNIANFGAIPAPVRGWNARDALASMRPDEAVKIENYIPSATSVDLRQGSDTFVGEFAAPVETLIPFQSPLGAKLFAAAGTAIYDVTAGTKVPVVTGMANARWQYSSMSNAGGYWLHMVNGADYLQLSDGATWESVTGVSTHAITGVDTRKLINVCLHQSRLWFVEKDSCKVWYLGTNAIAGAATLFDLSSVFRGGGFLQAMGSWTIDSGSGMDDHAAFISSTGEIAIYQGTDPSSISTWSLKGRYSVGAPIGYRCLEQYASDLLIISQDGLLPMSKALASSRVSTAVSLTDKINKPMAQATTDYASNFGWSVCLFPRENCLVVNIPVASGGSEQFVMYTITGAWTRFTNWHMNCMCRFGSKFYFGTNSAVVEGFVGTSDDGAGIYGECVTAFNYLKSTNVKDFTLAKLNLLVSGSPAIALGIDVDFKVANPDSLPTFSDTSAAIFDTALWDVAVWGGELAIVENWETVGAYGRCGAVHLQTNSLNSQISWLSTDILFEVGGGL